MARDPEPDAPEDLPEPTGQTLVSVRYGHVFAHGVVSVPDLTFTPQSVSDSSLTALRDAAFACGIDLIEEKQ